MAILNEVKIDGYDGIVVWVVKEPKGNTSFVWDAAYAKMVGTLLIKYADRAKNG